MDENVKITEESIGNIKISEEVVAIVASLAASEIPGVFGMANSISGGFYELIGKKNQGKGVKVAIDGNNTTIDMLIIVDYGCRIPEVAWEIQEKVKAQVETMTGLSVQKVNIHIQGVNIEKEAKIIDAEEEIEETTEE